jgi:adenine-specific DNA-methyltransferase
MPLNDYIEWQGDVIAEAKRITKPTGSIVWQVGNTYVDGGLAPLDCLLFPKFAEMQFINRIVWAFEHGLHANKRFSGRYEVALWYARSKEYYFNLDAVRVPQKWPGKKHYKGPKAGQLSCNPLGKNPGDWWEITNVKHNHPEKTPHPAQFPVEIPMRFISALVPPGGIVLDPFAGVGSTGVAARALDVRFIGIERDAKWAAIAEERLCAA